MIDNAHRQLHRPQWRDRLAQSREKLADQQLQTELRAAKREAKLVELLRKESYDAKKDFAVFSVQALAITAALIALIAKFMAEQPMFGLASIFAIVGLVTVAQMGTHRYAQANRLNGYELHLERMRIVATNGPYDWEPYMRAIGWEEAMRAWRIVEATVFEEVYLVSEHAHDSKISRLRRYSLFWRASFDRFRPKFAELGARQPHRMWFAPGILINAVPADPSSASAKAKYYPGGLLRTMLGVLETTVVLCFITLTIAVILVVEQSGTLYDTWVDWAVISGLIITGLVTCRIFWQVERRRDTIESGLLSIHACGMLWQAVVLAHYRALRLLGGYQGDKLRSTYAGYTQVLAVVASDLAAHATDIHYWLTREYFEKHSDVLLQRVNQLAFPARP